MTTINKYIELYSANRNRLLYPNQSLYEVPFCSYIDKNTHKKDPTVKGAIYSSITKYNIETPYTDPFFNPVLTGFTYYGITQPGTSASSGIVYIDPDQRVTYNGSLIPSPDTPKVYSLIKDYYKGYKIEIATGGGSTIKSLVLSYDPTKGSCVLKYPAYSQFGVLGPGLFYTLYPVAISGFGNGLSPLTQYIKGFSVPTVDDNNNIINNSPYIYNGYYLVNESPNSNSNQFNSNIIASEIYSYDNNLQIAYINDPKFSINYTNSSPYNYTLRKSLPEERWTLPITTYFNTIPPKDPIIGPLIGYIITLPEGANSNNNYYKGKYVYFYNNKPETYPGIYPQPEDTIIPISDKIFYPVYGLYYINAYNASTRQLSVSYEPSKYKNIYYPTYEGIHYNQKFFSEISGCTTYVEPEIVVDNNLYVLFDKNNPYIATIELTPNYFVIGRKYNFVLNLRDISTGILLSNTILTVKDNGNPVYTTTINSTEYTPQIIKFDFIAVTTNITFEFEYFPDPVDVLDPTKTYQIEFIKLDVSNIYYNSSSFIINSGITSISNSLDKSYKAVFNDIIPYEASLSIIPDIVPFCSYNICWCLKINGNYTGNVYFSVLDNLNPIYTSPYLTKDFIYYTFSIQPTSSNISFVFYYNPSDLLEHSVEWSYFFVLNETLQKDPKLNKVISQTKVLGMNMINITTLEDENFSPLSYNGSMVSINEAVCYSVSLVSLTLPNVPLKNRARISFYPYVYVELANSTSPTGASTQIIYSNNPNSEKALFIAPITQIQAPLENTFLLLSSSMTQLIKFKPNDNLRFSVYLPDGSLFETLDIDTLPPYEPKQSLQIDAVFSIKRMKTSSDQSIL
jgi:hypothetical protein